MDTNWTLNLAVQGADSNTRTYKNPDGSRVFVSSGATEAPGFLVTAWNRDFLPNLKVPYKNFCRV